MCEDYGRTFLGQLGEYYWEYIIQLSPQKHSTVAVDTQAMTEDIDGLDSMMRFEKRALDRVHNLPQKMQIAISLLIN